MLKKSKLLLAIMPFMLASCGGNNQCYARRASSVTLNLTKYGDPTAPHYNVMTYNLGLLDKDKVTVKNSDFSVEIDGNKIVASCLVDSIPVRSTTQYYGSVIESKDVTNDTTATSVYVGWETSVGITSSSNFYCKNQLVTTDAQIIKI